MRFRFSTLIALIFLALPLRSSSVLLLGGKYETTTDVQNLLNLALDAAAMRESGNLTVKLSIYQNGLNSNQTSSNSRVTLQSLSLNAKEQMSTSPMFNIFRYAFFVLGNSIEGESQGNFDGGPIEQYGDTLVNDLFSLGIKNIETEAALVTSVWMACAHQLFQAMLECRAGDKAKSLFALDAFAALWVGAGQEPGSNDKGSMLYNLAENAGERFGQDNGETMVNTRLFDLLQTLQTMLTSNKCANDKGHLDMRPIVKKMIGIMTIPLVQNLIHHSINLQEDGGTSFVELYALSTIPRVAACDPDAYHDELQLDVLRKLEPDQIQNTINAVQKAYSCLGITCAQVGSYLGGVVPQCQDENSVVAANYSTSRENARQKAFLDRDMKAIDIFLHFGAYGAAHDWYKYGWNSRYSLEDLATNQIVPSLPSGASSYWDLFQAYYKDPNFADNMITDILDRVPPYNSATKEQIRFMMIGVLQYVVVFATSASSLQYAVEMCSVDATAALQYWDTGSLFYIGSMEGSANAGSLFGGEFMFSTARELCGEFGTCVTDASANDGLAVAAANEVVVEGFRQVIDKINAGSCDVAKGILDQQILPTMIIPLIQGTIKYASYNAGLSVGTSDSSLAIGDTFARGILPIVNQNDQDSAVIIAQNTAFQLFAQPVGQGFPAVAEALRGALSKMPTVCADVGDFEDEPGDGGMCLDSQSGGDRNSTLSPNDIQMIAFGRFSFHNNEIAERDSSFALDVRDIFRATSALDAEDIYYNGSLARNESLSGESSLMSLASFSRHSVRKMGEDPMFNIYRYALYNDSDLEDGTGEDFAYADDVISESFDQAHNNKLSAEATIVMNIWMMIVHRLYDASRKCGELESPVGLIDSAVALWIGKEQQEGTFERGWGLYAVGQSAAQFYGLEEGEATVNTDLMRLFNEAQGLARECHKGQQGPEEMYFKVHELVRTLSKPLILNLLFHMVSGHLNMMALYAASVVPQAMACNEAVGESLQAVLFSSNYHQGDLTEKFLDDVASFLRCQRITPDDLRHSESVPEALTNLLNALTMRLESGLPSLVGYDAKTNVSEVARLDMDIQEIKIMMRTMAYEAAELIYKLGHNAYDDSKTRYQPIHQLATRASLVSGELPQEIYSKFYNAQFVSDDILSSAWSRSSDFAEATRGELAEIATRTLQTMVSYDAISDQMKSAREHCEHTTESADLIAAAGHWDRAVAMFVGSMEGPIAGDAASGNFLFGLANFICAEFGTCGDSGESRINKKLMIQFAAGRDAISTANCDSLQRLQDSISHLLSTILVQGTLFFVMKNNDLDNVSADTIGSLYVLAKSVIPLVARSNTTSAEILDSTLGNFATLTTIRPVSQIFQAFAHALRGMGVDCNDVGVPVSNSALSLCIGGEDITRDPFPATATNLGNGLYMSTMDVQDRADLAKDVAEMQEAIDSRSYEMAKLIYEVGKNSKVYDQNGIFLHLRSLKSLSVNETKDLEDDPLFNIFKFALQNEDGTFSSRDVRFYADSIVESAFANLDEERNSLPVEASLSLSLWMYTVHILHETLIECKKNKIPNGKDNYSIDIAAAYWIGDGQDRGSSQNGHLLYAMAEKASEVFQVGPGDGQSHTNTKILKLLKEVRKEIAVPGACTKSSSSYLRLSNHLHKIVSLMTVPLIQNLIHSLREGDREHVKLYAQSVIPLTASCKPETFEYLKEKLLHMTYNTDEIEIVIGHLRSVYPCLGLSCSDIGIHLTEVTPDLKCQDPPVLRSLAGYTPMYPVTNFAQLDLDLREIDILLQMEAFDAAETLYTDGKHASLQLHDGTMSLFHLGSSPQRTMVPEFDAFLRYYDSLYDDPSVYADYIIRSALNGTGYRWTSDQRRVVALKSMQVLVMYFTTLEPLYEALVTCENGDPSGDQWDQAAAFWLGSIEATEANASQSPVGYLYYELAQEHCREFGTCTPDGSNAQINERLLSLWFSGRGAISSGSCSIARDVITKISKLLLVPVVQGALSSAVHLQASASKKTLEMARANAFVYSRALLPLVASVNPDVAKVIDAQLGFPGPSSSQRTAVNVFSAFADVYGGLGIDCELIGSINGFDACHGGRISNPKKRTWIALGLILLVVTLCALAMYRWHRKVAKRLPENNPRFLLPETGETNHSMDLLEKAFAKKDRLQTKSSISEEKLALIEDMYKDSSSVDGHDTSSASSSHDDSLEVI